MIGVFALGPQVGINEVTCPPLYLRCSPQGSWKSIQCICYSDATLYSVVF